MWHESLNYEDIAGATTVGLCCGPTGNAEEFFFFLGKESGGGVVVVVVGVCEVQLQMLLHLKAEGGTQICKSS